MALGSGITTWSNLMANALLNLQAATDVYNNTSSINEDIAMNIQASHDLVNDIARLRVPDNVKTAVSSSLQAAQDVQNDPSEINRSATYQAAQDVVNSVQHAPKAYLRADRVNRVAAMAAHQIRARRAPVTTRASLVAHHVLGAESAATPTWKLVALAVVAGVAGYMTPGLIKKMKKK